MIVIAVPLAEQTNEVFDEVRMEGVAYRILASPGQGEHHMSYKVEAEGDTLRLYLAGAEFPVGIEELADKLSQIEGEPGSVQAQWFEVKESIARGSPD